MTERSSNGEYKYKGDDDMDLKGDRDRDRDRDRDDGGSEKQRLPLEKDRSRNEEKDHHPDKAGDYVRELLSEKLTIDPQKSPHALRLLDQEIQKTQAIGKPLRDSKYVDIYREKPIRVSVKVLVPVREHPKFNFVGKLLGPKGNSMKRLQEDTLCKMAVLGRGSMKDRQKEEEYRLSLDPKYAHLTDDLHVEITALAPPAEAHARIAYGLAEVRKYLIPDNNDNIRQEQMREMELTMANDPVSSEETRQTVRSSGSSSSALIRTATSRPVPVPRSRSPTTSSSRAIATIPPPTPPPPPPPPPSRAPITRPVPAKTKVFSILERARVAMNQSYGYEESATSAPTRSHDYDYHATSSSTSRYSDRHYSPSASEEVYPSSRYTTYEYDEEHVPRSSHDYYDTSDYPEESSGRAWKSYKSTTASGSTSRYRTAPYTRPKKQNKQSNDQTKRKSSLIKL